MTDAPVSPTDSDGPTWEYANTKLHARWAEPGGDWRDAAGVAQGSANYAVSPDIAAPGDVALPVTALVARLLTSNTGIHIKETRGLIKIASRTNPSLPGPRLHIVTTTGTFDPPCIVDTWLSPSSNSPLGGQQTLEFPAILKFDLSGVTGTVQAATLTLRVSTVYVAPAQIAVNYLDPPSLNLTASGAVVGPRVEGIAATVSRDAALASHPSVLLYDNLVSKEYIRDNFQGVGPGYAGPGTPTLVDNADIIQWSQFGLSAARVWSVTANQRLISWHHWAEPKQNPPKPWQRDFGDGHTRLFFRYLMEIGTDVKAGMTELGMKLPGMAGTYDYSSSGALTWPQPPSDGTWEMRLWHTGVSPRAHPDIYRLGTYFYGVEHPLSRFSGLGNVRFTNGFLQAGRVYSIEQEVKLNTLTNGVANADGVERVWIDGVLMYEDTAVRIRGYDNVRIQSIPWMNIYHGGLGYPSAPFHYDVGGIVVATEYIGPPKVITGSGTPPTASTTTSVKSSANPAQMGTTVTFTATVAGNNPTGFVGFTDGGASIAGCAAVSLTGSGNSRTAACSAAGLAQGTHTVVATYTGNSANAGSTSPALTQTINAIAGTPTTAAFLGSDVQTQGNWKGVYGSDGYAVVGDGVGYPSYAQVTPSGKADHTWASRPDADTRALQRGSSGRIAASWYGTVVNIGLNLTDGNNHKVTLYLVDWDSSARRTRVDILDARTQQVLATQSVSSFHNGVHLKWDLRGNVIVRLTGIGGPNAVISGLFFDAPGSSGGAPGGTPPVAQGSLAQAAAAMAPGTWAELITGNIGNVIARPGTNSSMIPYAGPMPWDPVHRQIHIVGGDHVNYDGLPPYYNRYDEDTNEWSILARTSLASAHGYEHTAVDSEGNVYLLSPWKSAIYRWNGTEFVHFAALPTNTTQQIALVLVYWSGPGFGAKGGLILYRGDFGSLHMLRLDTGTWENIPNATAKPMGGYYHSVAAYSAKKNVMVYGGGATFQGARNNEIWRLNADRSRTRMPDPPRPVGIFSGMTLVSDSASGNFLFLGFGELWELNPDGAGTWTRVTGTRAPPADLLDPASTPQAALVPVDVSSYGVTLWIDAVYYRKPIARVRIYKHAP